MRPSLIPRLRCPAGGGPLVLEGPASDWIEEGALLCPANGRRYPIKRGMAYLYAEDEHWRPLAAEAAGWVQMAKDGGYYDQTGVDIDFQLPYFPHQPWIDVARQFDIALDIVRPRPGVWVLDVGAGRGWAAKQFAMRGCNSVAIEINDDDQIGVGRSLAMMQQAGVRYDILIGSSQRLPVAEGSFDIAFASAALHHSTSIDGIVASMARTLRRGGKLVAIHEPCISDSANDADFALDIAEEAAYNINETRPRLDDYRRAVRAAGLRELALFTYGAYRSHPADLAAWSAQLGIPAPTVAEQQALERLRQPGLARHLRTLAARLRGHPDPANMPPQAWMDQLYRTLGGSMILIAERR
jgi:SAM-dependent methyltransferase